ncbi:MAG: VCBS repeat-containing protein, partial [Planctomycetes bacterium]|nr:VCBS repeat-containing protein [Planctomycetota bacterium]
RLVDVDGDGHIDLFMSVFAGDLKAEVARRLLGRVRLDYYLYLGTGKSQPFPRSPNHSLADKVDTQTFEDWGLRHRLMLTGDWNGDGKLDLVRTRIEDGNCHVEVRHATGAGSTFAFADSGPSLSWKGDVIDYTTTAIQSGRPAVRLKTATKVIYIIRP